MVSTLQNTYLLKVLKNSILNLLYIIKCFTYESSSLGYKMCVDIIKNQHKISEKLKHRNYKKEKKTLKQSN